MRHLRPPPRTQRQSERKDDEAEAMRVKRTIAIALELAKIRITTVVMITTLLGYLLAKGSVDLAIIPVLLGTLFLACGSAVFNHVQERRTDALMPRTRKRPIPSGAISPRSAVIFGMLLTLAGSVTLVAASGLAALALGVLAFLWYNGVYTPLKRKHPMAVIPGSLIGAIPPAIGWVAAGGSLLDEKILAVSFFFFVWQIPHFWLLMLFFEKDYRQAGFPTMQSIFSRDQILRITFIWMMGVCVLSIGLPLFGVAESFLIHLGLVLSAIWLSWNAFRFVMSSKSDLNLMYAFKGINRFALLLVILLSLDQLVV